MLPGMKCLYAQFVEISRKGHIEGEGKADVVGRVQLMDPYRGVESYGTDYLQQGSDDG